MDTRTIHCPRCGTAYLAKADAPAPEPGMLCAACLRAIVDRQTELLRRFVLAVADVGMTGDAGIDGAALAAEELLRDLGAL